MEGRNPSRARILSERLIELLKATGYEHSLRESDAGTGNESSHNRTTGPRIAKVRKKKAAGLPKPQALEWVFIQNEKNPRMEAFLRWLCSSALKSNVVTLEEADAFRALNKGGKLREGTELKEALGLASQEKKKSISEYQEDLSCLKTDVSKMEGELEALVEQRNFLSEHHLETQRMLENDRRECKTRTAALQSARNAIQQAGTNFDRHLAQLSRACLNHSRMLDKSEGKNPRKRSFMFRSASHEYKAAEEEFTSSILKYWTQQFHPEMEAAVEAPKVLNSLLDTRDIDNSSILHEAEEAKLREIWKELLRLKSLHETSVKMWIHSGERLAEAYALHKEAKNAALITKAGGSIESEKSRKSVEADNDRLSNEIEAVAKRIDSHLKEITELQIQPILLENWSIKCARHRYYGSKLKYLYESVVSQIARKRILMKGLKLERKILLGEASLLETTHRELEAELVSSKKRLERYKFLSQRKQLNQRNTIDARDQLLANVKALFETDPRCTYVGSNSFVSYKMLQNMAAQLSTDAAERESEDLAGRLQEKLNERVQLIENFLETFSPEELKELREKHADNSWLKNPKFLKNLSLESLRPKHFASAVAVFDKAQSDFQDHVIKVKEKHLKGQKEIRRNKVSHIERDLFVKFFTKRDKLQSDYAELKSRLEAQDVRSPLR